MKLHRLVTAAVLLVAFLPRCECRAVDASNRQDPESELDQQQQTSSQDTQPVLARLGEEYFIRLANGNRNSPRPRSESESSPAVFRRALQLQLTQRLLEGKVADAARFDPAERARRSEEPPISLDLTFHLLREVLEMARAEQLAQQAHSNRKMMEIFGK